MGFESRGGEKENEGGERHTYITTSLNHKKISKKSGKETMLKALGDVFRPFHRRIRGRCVYSIWRRVCRAGYSRNQPLKKNVRNERILYLARELWNGVKSEGDA